MGEREIRAKYGGHLPKAINRAIRAEVPGGNEGAGPADATGRGGAAQPLARRQGPADAGGGGVLPPPAGRDRPHGRRGPPAVGRCADAGPRDDGERPGKRQGSRAARSGTGAAAHAPPRPPRGVESAR